ncbi:hypothetical protein [uncultured Dokdonia sp.]|uniref:hypothetical protein n=1 Tax=uncultured Dokdonia sp. TaxID=575653 RepID=UPI002603E6A9|nr:hypothetical protein [uncultured Dokdonia sp.]
MKIFILLFCINFISFTPINNNADVISNDEIYEAKAIFDGYEGGYYFFTNEDETALQFESKDHPLLTDEKFKNGEFIGKSFTIVLKKNTDKDSLTAEIVSISYAD